MIVDVRHLVYQVNPCEIDSQADWCYQIFPHTFNGAMSNSDGGFQQIIEGVGVRHGAVFCKGVGSELLCYVPQLAAYLQSFLHKCGEIDELWPLSLSFRDELLLLQKDWGHFYTAIVKIDKAAWEERWPAYVLFTSLAQCLSALPESRSIARVYVAWQRYNLIKQLRESQSDNLVKSEFAAAYRDLTSLLLDEANSHAWYVLWKVGHEQQNSLKVDIPNPQIRQRLRLSMFLQSCSSSALPSNEGEADSTFPLSTPGCFDNTTPRCTSPGINLVSRFQDASGAVAIRRFINEELLPQYDLRSALCLTAFLSKLGRLGNYIGWRGRIGRLILPWLSLLTFISTLLIVFSYSCDSCSWADRLYFWHPSLPILAVGGPATLLAVTALLGFGLRNMMILFLPRVIGGILVGYIPVLTTNEIWYWALYSSQHHLVWAIEWPVVLLFAWRYLYLGVYPLVLDRCQAIRRSFNVLAWSVVQTMLVGFWLILISGPVYRQLEYTPNNVNAVETITTTVKFPCMEASGSIKPKEKQPLAQGLAYCFPVRWPYGTMNFPVSALLTFAPMSLLLGIILQIYWGDKPATASVWPSESR